MLDGEECGSAVPDFDATSWSDFEEQENLPQLENLYIKQLAFYSRQINFLFALFCHLTLHVSKSTVNSSQKQPRDEQISRHTFAQNLPWQLCGLALAAIITFVKAAGCGLKWTSETHEPCGLIPLSGVELSTNHCQGFWHTPQLHNEQWYVASMSFGWSRNSSRSDLNPKNTYLNFCLIQAPRLHLILCRLRSYSNLHSLTATLPSFLKPLINCIILLQRRTSLVLLA
jgi:hypothetical protein